MRRGRLCPSSTVSARNNTTQKTPNAHPRELTNPTMPADDDITEENSNNVVIISYKPLAPDSAVSANPHVPSVSASAVLGESESVSTIEK